MKIVAFNGSPRRGGNTEFLLGKALEPIAEAGIGTELIQVGGSGVHGCLACFRCTEVQNGRCAVNNDIVNDCISRMHEADGILLGSPSYFGAMTADLKALIDRAGLVSIANGRLLKHKIGAAVIAQRRGGATSVLDSINHFFLMSQMIVPGSTYWNFGVGSDKGEVAHDKEAMANMRDLGETMAWLVKKLHA